MHGFFFILLIPIVWALVAKRIWNDHFHWGEMGIQIAISAVIVVVLFFVGTHSLTADTEVWNGKITNKTREHGHYLDPYDCNCRDSCSGSGSNLSCISICDTCWEDRYTVTWSLDTTIGPMRVAHLDRGSKHVYREPDPPIYVAAFIGEPCSREVVYDNYIKAVPDSLFSAAKMQQMREKYAGKVPQYPRVHSLYKINRVLNVGAIGIDIDAIGRQLDEALITLGPQKQVNIVVILTEIDDQSYKYAVEAEWLGGKKNDVIVIVGLDGTDVTWADTITLGQNAGNSLMTVLMRDRILELGTLNDPLEFANIISSTIRDKFDRKPMADYEYLKSEISPPLWATIIAILLNIIAAVILTIMFVRNDTFGEGSNYKGLRRYRRYR